MALSADDILAIHALYAQYGRLFDNGDLEGWLALFTPDVSYQTIPSSQTGFWSEAITLEGIDALREFFPKRQDAVGNVRHFTTNIVVEGDGYRATGHSYGLSVDADTSIVRITGQSEDELVKVGGTWLFSVKTQTPDR